jgi:DNA-binding transcriptional regulator GbsR (MarR family)
MAQSKALRLDDLVDELGVSHGSVWHMLNEMNYRKVASRYVPHVLTRGQK